MRAGDNPGEHTIVFGLLGETIELVVRATNRDCYAHGGLTAAKFLAGRTARAVWHERRAGILRHRCGMLRHGHRSSACFAHAPGHPAMAKCEEGYLCDVCGGDVEEIVDSDLYLRFVIGQLDPETLHTTRERHIRCNPVFAQFIVDPDFPPIAVEGAFDKRQLDPVYVRERDRW